MPLLVIFILLPLLEIFTFVVAIDEIGFLNSFLLCILTAFIGVALVQKQGFDTLMRGRRELDQGGFPAQELFDGLCLFLAGAFFIVPGFITDGLGLLLLVPAVRGWLQAYALAHMNVGVASAHTAYHYTDPAGPPPRSDTIEGTYERVDEPDDEAGDDAERLDHRS